VPALQQIETARTNPSVTTLARISEALGVPIGELVTPAPPLGEVVRAADATVRPAGRASSARLLINDGEAPFVELWDFTVAAGDEIGSAGHPAGTRELLLLHDGRMRVDVGGSSFDLGVGVGVGDALRMRGDRPHTYANPGATTARLTIGVVYAGERDPRYLPRG